MAGDCDCQRIGAAGLGNRAHRIRRAETFCDVAVACRRSRGYISQRLPDTLLKGRSMDIERKMEAERRRFDEPDHFCDELLKNGVTACQIRPRELVLQFACERCRV